MLGNEYGSGLTVVAYDYIVDDLSATYDDAVSGSDGLVNGVDGVLCRSLVTKSEKETAHALRLVRYGYGAHLVDKGEVVVKAETGGSLRDTVYSYFLHKIVLKVWKPGLCDLDEFYCRYLASLEPAVAFDRHCAMAADVEDRICLLVHISAANVGKVANL